jgi:3-deoxy-7-phosphoheptulonate synthase
MVTVSQTNHYEDLMLLIEEYEKRNLENPAIIIDVNHANSDKKFINSQGLLQK